MKNKFEGKLKNKEKRKTATTVMVERVKLKFVDPSHDSKCGEKRKETKCNPI